MPWEVIYAERNDHSAPERAWLSHYKAATVIA